MPAFACGYFVTHSLSTAKIFSVIVFIAECYETSQESGNPNIPISSHFCALSASLTVFTFVRISVLGRESAVCSRCYRQPEVDCRVRKRRTLECRHVLGMVVAIPHCSASSRT